MAWVPVQSQVRRATLALAAAALAVGLVGTFPAAGATPWVLNDPEELSGSVALGQAAAGGEDAFFMVFGALRHQATFTGPVFLLGAEPGSAFHAATVRVYDVNDPASVATEEPFFESDNASLVPDEDATLMWSVADAHVGVASRFSFALFFDLNASLPDMGVLALPRTGPAPPSLIASADAGAWTFAASGERSYLLPITGGFSIENAERGSQHFGGTDWLVTFRGRTSASLGGAGIAFPVEASSSVTFGPADPGVYRKHFDLDAVTGFLGRAGSIASGFDPPSTLPGEGDVAACESDPRVCSPGQGPPGDASDTGDDTQAPLPETPGFGAAADILEDLSGILNGAIVGTIDGNVNVAARSEAEPGFSIVRFESITFDTFSPERAAFHGSTPLAYTGGQVVEGAKAWRIGPFILPYLSVGLFAVAIGALVVSRVRTFRAPDEARSARLAAPARITRWVVLGVTLVLFDRELHAVLGESLLGFFRLYPSAALGLVPPAPTASLAGFGIILLLQAGLWGGVAFAFGLPVGLLGKAGLRMGGFDKRLNGFAFAAGAVATWLFGAALIKPLLGVLFSAIPD